MAAEQESHRRSRRRQKVKPPFLASLGYALAGIIQLLRHERNARIEAAIGLLVVVSGILLQISASEWAILFVCISLVLALEAVNSSLEAVVNLVTDEYHDLAKMAKDGAAGAVLLAVLGSIGVGITIFLPRLWPLLLLLL